MFKNGYIALLKYYGIYKKNHFRVTDRVCEVLSAGNISALPEQLQIYSHLLYVYDPGLKDPRAMERPVIRCHAICQVPSMGRKWF
jgi:hypothetical protein